MSSPYEQGRLNSGLHTGDREPTASDHAEYARGVLEYQGRGVMDTSRVYEAGHRFGEQFAANPVKALGGLVRELIVLPVVVGSIGAGVALVLGQPAANWGLIVGAVTFTLLFVFSMLMLVGAMIGVSLKYLVVLLSLPFSLWRWWLSFGAMGAGVGFALATMAKHPSALVQQQTMDLGLRGLVVGFALGATYRVVRALSRRVRPRRP